MIRFWCGIKQGKYDLYGRYEGERSSYYNVFILEAVKAEVVV